MIGPNSLTVCIYQQRFFAWTRIWEGPRPLLIHGFWESKGIWREVINDHKVFIAWKFSEASVHQYVFFWFIFLLGHERWRRSHVLSNFSSCSPEGTKKWLECMEKQNGNRLNYNTGVHVEFDVSCTYKTHDCFYVYTCKPKGGGDYECSQEAHFLQYTGICCVPIC